MVNFLQTTVSCIPDTSSVNVKLLQSILDAYVCIGKGTL